MESYSGVAVVRIKIFNWVTASCEFKFEELASPTLTRIKCFGLLNQLFACKVLSVEFGYNVIIFVRKTQILLSLRSTSVTIVDLVLPRKAAFANSFTY